MKKGNFRDQKWYPNTIAICSGVVLYVALTNLPAIMHGLKSIRIYFSTVLWGCVIAYTINPLASFWVLWRDFIRWSGLIVARKHCYEFARPRHRQGALLVLPIQFRRLDADTLY